MWIDGVVAFALKNRAVMVLIYLALAVFGYYSWNQLSIEAYPDIADVTALVTTSAPGLAAEEVEQQVTIPLERELNGTPGLTTMRSRSTFGLSLTTLVFRDGTEDYFARQRVQERIQDVELPAGLSASLGPLASPTGEIYKYILQSDSKNLRELSEIQFWTVIPALKQIPGTAEIENFGGITTQFQLELDPQQLMAFNLSLKDVSDAVSANSTNAGGSVMTRGELGYVIRGIGLVQTLQDMGDIVVTQRNGVPILVRDLGKVQLSNQERHGILGKDDQKDVIGGIVLLLRNENPSRVMDAVHAKVAELNERLKVEDVQLVPYLDRSTLVTATKDQVFRTIAEGIGLVLIVLILFLGSPRAALIVCITIPFAMLMAFIGMYILKIPANLLSLGAIDFGIIVDGAIVMAEAILRRREANPTVPLTEDDVREAAVQVAGPIFFSTLIIITVYFPLFFLQRVEAKLFSPMVYAVGFAQFGALLIALRLIPGLTYLAYRKPRRVFHNPVLAWLERGYRRTLQGSLNRPGIVYVLCAAALGGVIWFAFHVEREFLPELDEGVIQIHVTMPPGISLAKATELAADLRNAAREFPEVSYAVTAIGRNDEGTDPWTPSHIEGNLGLHPYDTWPKGSTKPQFMRRLKDRLTQPPIYDVNVSQPIIESVTDAIFGVHSKLVVRIFNTAPSTTGQDFNEMRRIGSDIVEVLKTVPGAIDAGFDIDQQPPLPQVAIKVDRAASARFGINVSDVADLIRIGIGGEGVSQIFIGERRYDTSVRFPEETRNNTEAIGRLLLASSSGALIPLSQITNIQLQLGESTITRWKNQRNLTVKLNNRDRTQREVLTDASKAVEQKVTYDKTRFRLEWGGEYENTERAEAQFRIIIGLVLGLMIILLYAQFRVLPQVFLILGVVPLATLGGLAALYLTGNTLNVASGVGFIALFGVAVMNGVIMVANLNRVREMGLPLMEAVLAGANERLRPVLMTATVATVGMLPAATTFGIGSDVQRNLGTVVAGGLLLATFLTLFIIPALYYVIERRRTSPAVGTPAVAAPIGTTTG